MKPNAMSYPSDSDEESARAYSSVHPHMNAMPLKLLLPQRHGLDDDKEGSLVIDEKKTNKAARQRGPIKLRLSGSFHHFLSMNEINCK